MSDMRTPLGKVRGLGSAREGTEHFWRQRLTAIANIPLILFFVGFLIVAERRRLCAKCARRLPIRSWRWCWSWCCCPASITCGSACR